MAKPTFAVVEFKLPKEMRYCTMVDFGADGRTVVGLNGDGYAAVWDAGTTEIVRHRHLPNCPGPPDFWMAPHRRAMVVSSAGKPALLVDTKTLGVTPMSLASVTAVGWDSTGDLMAVGDRNGSVEITKSAGGEKVAAWKFDNQIFSLAFFNDTSELLVGTLGGILFTWAYRGGKPIKRRENAGFHKCLSQDGKTLVTLSGTRTGCAISQIDTTTWKARVSNFAGKHHKPSLSSDARRLAFGSGSTIIVWDLAEGRPWLKWKKPHYNTAMGVAFSEDGQRLACCLNYKVHILDFRSGAQDRVIELPKAKAGEHQCLEMVGPDDRMDLEGGYGAPLNPLPVKCAACEIVDLNAVPSPYVLGRKIESPAELAPAIAGNLLVREPMRRVLEVAAPGQCKFNPTISRRTKQPTPWLLAVPQHVQTTAAPKGKACARCHEPRDWEDIEATSNPCSGQEILKSGNLKWHPQEHHLYFSVRLETLVSQLGLRGLVRSDDCKQLPSIEDQAWVKEKLLLLKQADGKAATRSKTEDGTAWFKEYLEKNAKEKPVVHDAFAVEKKHAVKLPESYKQFIARIGTKTYRDIDEEEGFFAHILPPKRLDFKTCRRTDEDEGGPFNGVVFATTDHGDVFCFNLGGRGSDYEVHKYDHELDSFEPYAKSFAECIKRFAGK